MIDVDYNSDDDNYILDVNVAGGDGDGGDDHHHHHHHHHESVGSL